MNGMINEVISIGIIQGLYIHPDVMIVPMMKMIASSYHRSTAQKLSVYERYNRREQYELTPGERYSKD